jgi:hypothetical protein
MFAVVVRGILGVPVLRLHPLSAQGFLFDGDVE